MEKYKFYQDEKQTIWQRHHFTIEADNEKQAIEIAMQYANESIFNTDRCNWHDESEILFEFQAPLSVADNNGCSTLELYDWNKKKIGSNA